MNNYALITAGASGIGYELTKLFAGDGYNLRLVARNQSELDQVQQVLSANGIDVITLAKDLFIKEQVFEV
ncbi:SDR family NAD(P)-dependent oxidoreductase [Dyadobacter sp. CY312]|uniref:SDR family NAD(P)-dependent oxidoreductase n=1 Tax=Dyadobacter sp. CY312 TaxID=2907303 RepID=UPI001F24A602|nr:SDR family NAD(P)-dependent oxidoreductase [Dyadobacter sp. CY312]MCE7042881.1 SDR family NAD(P)-dependent oxidoreductase [Dyadobacter sp. CY312]